VVVHTWIPEGLWVSVYPGLYNKTLLKERGKNGGKKEREVKKQKRKKEE
jgi:hypothetical protein